MKLTFLTLLATALVTTQAYEMHVTFDTGVEVRVTGDHASPCQDFPREVRDLKIKKITFDKGYFTNEFFVWSKVDCGGTLVKRSGSGIWDFDPAASDATGIGSFKIM